MKYKKIINIPCVFKILWCFGGIRAIQGAKCDQPTQCLKRHGIKRHGAYWFLKQHSQWVIWICHLMPFNSRKYHLKRYQTDMVFFRSYAMHCCSCYSIIHDLFGYLSSFKSRCLHSFREQLQLSIQYNEDLNFCFHK